MKKLIAITLLLSLLLSGCGAGTQAVTETETLPMDIYQKADPSQDDRLNILMIGSSFCFYYVEELYGMLEAAGIKANVCNVYYSGCPLEKHWTWWKNNEAHYDYYMTNENGRSKVAAECSLEYCLQQMNWDIISLQENTSRIYTPGAQAYLETSRLWRTELWAYLKEQFPLSRHLWHQPWARQVGIAFNGTVTESAEQQQYNADQIKAYAVAVCKELDLERVNSGEAWQIVRNEYGYDKLCARIGKTDSEGNINGGDGSHDGDWGGGQYLNACVWFEVITGESCIGNTYRPRYMAGPEDLSLSEDMIQMLQESAHKAVEQMKSDA